MNWVSQCSRGPHEANYLKLDCSRLKQILGWKPSWNIEKAIEMTVEWSKCWVLHEDVKKCMDLQIETFLKGVK